MEKYVRLAKSDDAHELATKVRQEDLNEIKASHNALPLQALLHPFKQLNHKTYSIIGTKQEGVIGMFGVVPSDNKEYGVAWLLSSSELLNHTLQFLRECPKWIEEMGQDYKYLYNYVDVRNEVGNKWLKFLGFNLIDTVKYGYEKKLFNLMIKEIK